MDVLREKLTAKQLRSLLVLVIVVTGLIVGLVLIKRELDNRGRALVQQVDLEFSPANISVPPSGSFSVDVMMNTNNYSVSAANLIANFDPSVLQLTSITGGTILPTVIQAPSIGTSSGQIVVGAGCDAGSCYPFNGSSLEPVATLSFQAISTGVTQITFGSDTGISAVEFLQGYVNTTLSSATVTIGSEQSCSQTCVDNGFLSGVCRASKKHCSRFGETYMSTGDQFCTGGANADTCCCQPQSR